ncbi:MAG TPA: hypothetical protein VJT72_03065 [Pseudonocardiaceae bacterium]|nr:hypothetical protein [Pseudonocardiaceae bacterium]
MNHNVLATILTDPEIYRHLSYGTGERAGCYWQVTPRTPYLLGRSGQQHTRPGRLQPGLEAML